MALSTATGPASGRRSIRSTEQLPEMARLGGLAARPDFPTLVSGGCCSPVSRRSGRRRASRQSLHCCRWRCVLEACPVASAERRFLARFGPAPRAHVAASPAGLGRTADAQELRRQGSGSVGVRMTAVPVRELTLSTHQRHSRSRTRRLKADFHRPLVREKREAIPVSSVALRTSSTARRS
jgi:hypothetical protein